MKRDLHLKKVYVAVVLTAITIIPTAFAIGAFLDNNKKSNKATSMAHQQAEVQPKDACN